MLKWDPPQVIGKGAAPKPKPQTGGGMTVEELLDAVVAPKTSPTNDGGMKLQRISSTPATKTDVTRLTESLDQQLLQRQARETGICPVREGLYREAFGALFMECMPGCTAHLQCAAAGMGVGAHSARR
jgi:dynein light intermediate chain